MVIKGAEIAANNTFASGLSPFASSAATMMVKKAIRTLTGRESLIKAKFFFPEAMVWLIMFIPGFDTDIPDT
jgi:hypothetical protein